MKKTIGLALAAFLVAGCATKQKIRITTIPEGASLTIIQMGEKRKTQDVAGSNVSEKVEPFQDKPESIGTSPKDFKFEPYHEGWVRAGLYKFKESKHCLSAKVIAEKDGMTAEKVVSFDADHDPVEVELSLEQAPKEKK
jgi:hypothetical protein